MTSAIEVEEKNMRSESIEAEVTKARRRFLANCGKFAIATPPAISLLLAASRTNYAVASSGSASSGSGGSGGSDPPMIASADLAPTDPNNATDPNNPSGGAAAGRNCGDTFQALWNNDKCFR